MNIKEIRDRIAELEATLDEEFPTFGESDWKRFEELVIELRDLHRQLAEEMAGGEII